MHGEEVALASLALAATAVGAIIWITKYFANTLSEDLKEHTRAAVEQTTASKELIKTVRLVGKNSQEHYLFMKKLNGSLKGPLKKAKK